MISLAGQTLKLLKLLQSWSLTPFLANFQQHHQSGHLRAWQAFPRVYFTGGQGEIASSSNLRFVVISITCNNSMYQCSDWSFTDKSVVCVCFACLFLHRDAAAAALGWQGAVPCSLHSCGTSRHVLSLTFVRGTKKSRFQAFLNFFCWLLGSRHAMEC